MVAAVRYKLTSGSGYKLHHCSEAIKLHFACIPMLIAPISWDVQSVPSTDSAIQASRQRWQNLSIASQDACNLASACYSLSTAYSSLSFYTSCILIPCIPCQVSTY